MASARRKSDSSSSREKSCMARKSRCTADRLEGEKHQYYLLNTPYSLLPSKYILAQILILRNHLQPLPHNLAIYPDRIRPAVGQVEQVFFEQRGHHGMQPPRSDVLHTVIHGCCDTRNRLDPVRSELERCTVCLYQRRILLRERILRLRHYPHEILLGERLKLHANREPSLQLRNQVTRLRDVECTCCDEENVIGFYQAVLRLHVAAFHDRQEVSLYTLTR